MRKEIDGLKMELQKLYQAKEKISTSDLLGKNMDWLLEDLNSTRVIMIDALNENRSLKLENESLKAKTHYSDPKSSEVNKELENTKRYLVSIKI
jgi:regulator of replication initiation timing